MMLKVFSNALICDRARASHEVTTRPKVLAPVSLSKLRKFLLQLPRTNPLDVLHKLRRCELRRGGNQQMQVIRGNTTTYNLHVVFRTDQTHQFPKTYCKLPSQNRIAILRNPSNVILQFVTGMCTLADLAHHPRLAEAFA